MRECHWTDWTISQPQHSSKQNESLTDGNLSANDIEDQKSAGEKLAHRPPLDSFRSEACQIPFEFYFIHLNESLKFLVCIINSLKQGWYFVDQQCAFVKKFLCLVACHCLWCICWVNKLMTCSDLLFGFCCKGKKFFKNNPPNWKVHWETCLSQ